MKPEYLFSILLMLATSQGAPLKRDISKRSLPRLGGVNLAGCDFGMTTDGTSGTYECPPSSQIAHFVNDGVNAFRLPVGWQYLVGSSTDSSSSSLDSTFFATYDALIKGVTDTGAYALIDIHNYARWNGQIIGQGGPSNADFASLWSLLAVQYADNDRVMFGLMNEPWGVDITQWAATCQVAVNAIRAAGATTQTIILPGNDWDNAGEWSDGDDSPILTITDPATGDTSLLILDVHKYLDSDGSGTSAECTTNGLDLLEPLAQYLSDNGRQAIISEIGGGDTDSCISYLAQALDYITQNDDVFVGFTDWAAGSFEAYPGYALSITPNADGTDNNLFISAIKPYLPSSSQIASSVAAAISATTTDATTIAATYTATTNTIVTMISNSNSNSKATSVSSVSSGGGKVPVAATSTARSTAIKANSTASAATSTSTGTNLQTYTGSLGGITAPAVTASGTWYICNSQTYNFLVDALSASCYDQMNSCQIAANEAGNVGDLIVSNCEGELQDCLTVAANA